VVALWTWFFALAYLPVSTAMTLNYMSGIWVAAFVIGGGMLAGSQAQGRDFLRQQGPLALSVLAGFGGVILILQPTMASEQFLAALLGLMSGMAAALAFLQVAAMTRIGEPETRIVFYFALGSTLAGALGMTVQGVSAWSWEHALWLLPIGLLASLGQLSMTYAYGSGATLLATCLQYSGIVFATLYALLLFGERIPPAGWIGMGLIVASGIIATILRVRTVPNAPAEEI
jgi:drug/metabolite transporter (DMT)-like permease